MEIDVVRVAEWARYPWLVHGFSTRIGGVSTVYGGGRTLNLGFTKEDDAEAVTENRRLAVEAVGGESVGKLRTLKQVHGTAIHVVEPMDETQVADERPLEVGDGLMTTVPGVLLAIQTADCVPVMIVDVALRAVAVLHAGWRGTVAGMARVGAERMRAEYGSRVEDMVAAVGPAIGPCCYAVGEEMRAAFCGGFAYGDELFEESGLNLWEANRRQLLDAGLAAERITVVGECTACARTASGLRRYFSHRAEHGVTGRMMSVVGVRADA